MALTLAAVYRAIDRRVAPIKRRGLLAVQRAVVSGVSEALKMRGLQIKLLDGEDDDGVEHFEPYGLTARPSNGAEAIVLSVGGSTAHPVAVVVSDRGGERPTDLLDGEVALYSKHGQSVILRTDGSISLVPKAGETVNHGSETPADAMALALKTETELNALRTWALAHVHPTAAVGSPSPPTVTVPPLATSSSGTTGSTVNKAD
jgi:phage baseplate assembly protein V